MSALAVVWRKRLVILIGVGLVVASICNGAVFYLKRIGVVDRTSYLAYWVDHCEGKDAFAPWTVTASDPCEKSSQMEGAAVQASPGEPKDGYLYRPDGVEIALKLLKDVLAIGFVLLSLHLGGARRPRYPAMVASWPLVVMTAVVIIGFAISCMNQGATYASAGLRQYLFLAIALTGGWVARDMGIFARCIALLLGIEVLLMPLEFAFGMHIHGHFGDSSFVRRLSGTFVAPNSFGIFVVAGLAFYHAFSGGRKYLPYLSVTAAFLVAASGSGTAWLALFLFVFAISTGKFEGPHPITVSFAAILLCVLLLPWLPALVGRMDVFDSVFGPGARLDEITSAFHSASGLGLLFGSGIGVGTNTGAIVFGPADPALWAPANSPYGAESAVAALIRQSGLPGLFAFYSLLAWASVRDRRARLFYLVIALSSLTAKITELFPVNFLLGLALAHSIQCSTAAPAVPATDDGPQKERD